ncbi:Crp/Fnr family transcriptional regulator [Pedobacter sp. G11]|uniref:Crp/Fnr family transcriptional regulator n=1 Tax=Pedobacter sp. G11 TaxID=2482728 RepID=UPI0011D02384|nr:Crp/Fnr family transcriptional regulator [Pedobacter sp. G11]
MEKKSSTKFSVIDKQMKQNQSDLNYFRECLTGFQTFSDEEWLLFSSALSFQEFKKNELIFDINEVYQKMIFITNGAVRYFVDKNGEIITSYFSFRGDVGSAYSSFISAAPSSSGLQAIQATRLIVLTKKKLEVLSDNPLIALKIEQMRRRIAEFYILCYDQRTRTFLMQSPEKRYLELLNSGGEIFQQIPQHYIANYLGITPVSLSRIRSRSMAKS